MQRGRHPVISTVGMIKLPIVSPSTVLAASTQIRYAFDTSCCDEKSALLLKRGLQ